MTGTQIITLLAGITLILLVLLTALGLWLVETDRDSTPYWFGLGAVVGSWVLALGVFFVWKGLAG